MLCTINKCAVSTLVYLHLHVHISEMTHPLERRDSCNDNQQTSVNHLGENNTLHFESFKKNYCMISLWAIIRELFIHGEAWFMPTRGTTHSHEWPQTRYGVATISRLL